jgi:hypothetical protein
MRRDTPSLSQIGNPSATEFRCSARGLTRRNAGAVKVPGRLTVSDVAEMDDESGCAKQGQGCCAGDRKCSQILKWPAAIGP